MNKFKVYLLLTLIVLVGIQNPSYAESNLIPSTSKAIEAPEELIQIPLNSKQSVYIPKHIDYTQLAKSMNLSEDEVRAGYESLSENEKQNFSQKRLQLLTQTAQILYKTRFSFGIGRVVGRSFEFIKNSYTTSKNVIRSTLGLSTPTKEKPETVDSDLIAADDLFQDLVDYHNRTEVKRQEIKKDLLRSTAQEKNRLIIESFIQAIDYKLWYQAPLFITSNEYSISSSLGLLIEGGFRDTGYGGSEDIGVALAFNDQQKAVIFEIYHLSDQFLKSDMAVAVIGLNMKVNFSMFKRNLNTPTKTLYGETYYPPAAPISSGFGAEYYTFGLGTSIGLPPPPLADLLTYTNSTTRITWLRLGVSPLHKGYVRLYKGEYTNTYHILRKRFVDIYHKIGNIFSRRSQAKLCQNLF